MKTKVFMLAIVMGVMYTILLSQAWAIKMPDQNLIGLPKDQAVSILKKAGFTIEGEKIGKWGYEITDKKHLHNRVAGHSLIKNFEYPRGTTVAMTLYKYQEPHVPKVIDFIESHAVGVLKREHYQVRVLRDGPKVKNTELWGRVAKQEPSGGTVAPWGTVVTIHLYQRPK